MLTGYAARLWRGRSKPMMHLFINSLAANTAGGLTYLGNELPLAADRGQPNDLAEDKKL